jgi:hypothetical protein
VKNWKLIKIKPESSLLNQAKFKKEKFMRPAHLFLAPKAPFSKLLPLDKYIAKIINIAELWATWKPSQLARQTRFI